MVKYITEYDQGRTQSTERLNDTNIFLLPRTLFPTMELTDKQVALLLTFIGCTTDAQLHSALEEILPSFKGPSSTPKIHF